MTEKTVRLRIVADDQATPAFQRLGREMERTGQQAQRTNSIFSDLGQNILGAITIGGAIQLGSQLYNLGREASIAASTFTQLSGGASEAAANMDLLRVATGGIVDDMTLMQGSSKLLQMGLATTGGEVARLTELAVKLGGAMGSDATSSIENFALLLANQSVLRLDTFGISSARVRAEIERLMETGEALNREDAFRMAVLSEGAVALDRLGSAADAAVTPVARLQTRWANFAQDFSERAAIIVEQAAATVDQLTLLIEGFYARGLEMTGGRDFGFPTMLGVGVGSFIGQQIAGPTPTMAPQQVFGPAPATREQSAAAYIRQSYGDLIAQGILERLRSASAASGIMNIYGPDFYSAVAGQQQTAMAQFQQNMIAQLQSNMTTPFFELIQLQGNRQPFYSREEANQAEVMFSRISMAFDALRDADVDASILEPMTRAADQAREIRDYMVEGADRLENITLPQSTGAGQNPNELFGDISQQFLSGVDYNQYWMNQFALQSGAATPSSIAIDQLITRFQTLYGNAPQAGMSAIGNLETFLRQAAAQGASQEQIVAGIQQLSTFGGGEMGLTRAFSAADIERAANATEGLTNGIEEAQTAVEDFDAALQEVTSKSREIEFKLKVDDASVPAWMKTLIGAGAFNIVGLGTQQGNGRVPGSTTTGGRSGSSRPDNTVPSYAGPR